MNTLKPPAQKNPPENPSPETKETVEDVSKLGKAASGAIAGAMIGAMADPLTAIAGAAACAVLAATDSLKTEN